MAEVPTFALPTSFLGIRRTDFKAGACIAGVPHDVGTSNRPGARFGPAAIRYASRMLVDGDHPTHWLAPAQLDISDIGDFSVALGDINTTLRLIERQAATIDHLVALGGDHSITLPLLRALGSRLDRPLALIHFDAHVDTWPDSFGQVYGHGSPFFHAINEGLVDPRHMVQLGIRSPMQRKVFEWTREKQVTILSALDIHESGMAAIAARIREAIGDRPVYLSFDIDALDPAFAPATGTPEVGGLSTWQAQALIRRLSSLRFVGMDVVEVAPAYDHAEITALAAATLVWEYLALVAANGLLPSISHDSHDKG